MADLLSFGAPIVRVSAACARLPFTECGPACIAANDCNGNCCDAPSRPSGCMVSIHDSEKAAIEARGASVRNGFIEPAPGAKGCPFKREGLCALHGTPAKPFGCIASPFTLNANDTLIVRNRYKLLPCYRGPGPKAPAYRVFKSSLAAIFDSDAAVFLGRHFDKGGGDISLACPPRTYAMLKDNDAAKRAAKGGE